VIKWLELSKTILIPGAIIMRIKSWHKNHALLMASHLPTDVEDARIVLELLRNSNSSSRSPNRNTAPNALTS
jgi:hypothetical protein